MKKILSFIFLFIFPTFLMAQSIEPVVIKISSPEYPKIALKTGLTGVVHVEIVINENGKIEKATVVKSTNHVFDKPSLKAAKESKFKPAMLDGKPIKTTVTVPFKFELKK